MSLGGGKTRDPTQPVSGKVGGPKELQDELEKLIGQGERFVKETSGEKKPVDPQLFQQNFQNLPRLIQKTLQKLEASQVYQTFKLAGSDYVVHDRREARGREAERQEGKKDAGRSIAEESKMSLEELLLQRGKLTAAKEKGYENYLGDPSKKILIPEQRAAQERLNKLFTHFEKALLRRFEQGEEMAQLAEPGRFSFLKKTADQWRQFFAHFTSRTVKRHVSVNEVQEWIFRGLVQKNAKATVVADLSVSNGQLEKFVRFRLSQAAQSLAERLAQLEPGARLSQSELEKYFSEELEYLAIKNAEPDAAWALGPTKGKFFGTAQAEEKVASDLGLQLSAQLREKQKVLRDLGRHKKGAGGSGWGDEEGASEEVPKVFVPWWSWPFQKRTGPVRWFVAVTYLVIISLLVLGLWSLVTSH